MMRGLLYLWVVCIAVTTSVAAQEMPSYAAWGSAIVPVNGADAAAATARDRAGEAMAARTGAGTIRPRAFYVVGGSWDHDRGLLGTVLIGAAGRRYVAEEDSVDAAPRGHLFTLIGAAASMQNSQITEHFEGMIAEVLVFDRVLGESEQAAVEACLVQRHLQAGADATALPVTDGLILRLDAADFAETWRDASGHGNDAVVQDGGVSRVPSATPAGGAAVRFTGEGYLRIDAGADGFDAPAHTWYVVFSVNQVARAPLISSAYRNIARPLRDGDHRIRRMTWNNPGLMVDLSVGLWAHPLPMDTDHDGVPELYVASTGKPDNGIYRFRPLDEGPGATRFHPGEKVAWATLNLRASQRHDGSWVLMSPGRIYEQFAEHGLTKWKAIDYTPTFYTGRANHWSLFDYDGDGIDDLIIGTDDWREYGWDDAFDEEGAWTNGPLRGFVWWVENTGTNDQPQYAEAQQVMGGGKPIETYGNPVPNFTDFNGDGLPDLICGEFLDRLTFYENVGTRTRPQYAPGRFLKHDGEVLRFDVQMIMPAAIDWDRDGHVDLVVGEEDGTVSLLRNTGRTDDGMPRFDPPRRFQQIAHELKIGALCTPATTDFDGDGDVDLILGDSAGYVSFLENLGGIPVKWAAPVKLLADGETIRIQAGGNGSIQGPAEAKWGYTVVDAADWDHDGLPDLLLNNIWGKVLWYRNVGTRTAPKLAAAQPVKVAWEGQPRAPAWNWWKPGDNQLVTQWRSSIQAIDLTDDGLLDLVALDEDGYLVLFERRDVAGELVLRPGRRIFHVEPGEPTVYDHNHHPMWFDENGDNVNDLAQLDADGRLPFHYRQIAFDGKTRDAPIRFADRAADPRYAESANRTALRLTSGWAGRSGRRKFVLSDWDGDGRLDLLVNSVNVVFMRNVADVPGTFLFRNMGAVDDKVLAGHTTCPATADLDGDGKADLVIGGEDGHIYFMANPN